MKLEDALPGDVVRVLDIPRRGSVNADQTAILKGSPSEVGAQLRTLDDLVYGGWEGRELIVVRLNRGCLGDGLTVLSDTPLAGRPPGHMFRIPPDLVEFVRHAATEAEATFYRLLANTMASKE